MSKNLLSLLLVVATFAVYYLAIGPLYKGTGGVWQPEQSIQSLQVLNKQYDETLAQADGLRSQAESLKADYTRISDEQKAQMAVMVPNSIDKVRLLDELSNVLEDAGFSSKDLSVSDGITQNPGMGSASVSFKVKTNYTTFKQLMNTFEKSLRLFSLQSVTFSAPEKEGDLISYDVRLETYYLK